MEKVMLDNNAQDKMEDEEPSLFHNLKMVKRRETRIIRQVLDIHGNDVSGHRNVLNTFAKHLRQKYEPIEVDQTCHQATMSHTTHLSNEVCRTA